MAKFRILELQQEQVIIDLFYSEACPMFNQIINFFSEKITFLAFVLISLFATLILIKGCNGPSSSLPLSPPNCLTGHDLNQHGLSLSDNFYINETTDYVMAKATFEQPSEEPVMPLEEGQTNFIIRNPEEGRRCCYQLELGSPKDCG